MKYVLITPARNEEWVIEKALDSMVLQTKRPERWIIVDDGSTDRTADLVAQYTTCNPWIVLLRRPKRELRNFAGKVQAFAAGLNEVQSLAFDLVGNLDADISFGRDHFEFLVTQFSRDPTLGVAGTAYTEANWNSTEDSFEGEDSVHGACQLFRRKCFADIGGYQANPAGGIDWMAVTTARMKGWRTRNFREKRFVHHRKMGTAETGALGAMFDYGAKDYFLGGSPLWELFRVAYRAGKPPYVLGGLALLLGYSWSFLRQIKRPVSPELMRFHRDEQMTKLKHILGSLIRLRKINKFRPSDHSNDPIVRRRGQ